MGVLYLALDPAIDRLIAVKLLRVADDELRERFLREARLAARLQHPNIVTIYDVGSHDGQPFIAMEYIAGETLAELIQRKAPLALLRKLELALDACQGLAYAHKNGIVHRDIKPANLMVSRDAGVLKVLDFGIARGADSTLTQIGMLMGTPNYMAPEQIEGKPIDQRADIFAVGLVLYELLVYRQAFKAETPHAVLHQVLHQSPKPLRELDAALDASLITIVERAIAKDPAKRYSELERLRADLVRVVQRLKTEVDADTVAVPAADVEAARQGGRRELDRQRLAERRAAQIATHLAAAEAALATNDADAALAAAESAALLAPEDPMVVAAMDRAKTAIEAREIAAFMAAAREHMRAGEMTEAGEAVMEALQIDPRHSGAQALRIQIDRAVEERERARERARAVARALAQADQSLAAGALDAALRATGEALGHDPSSPEAQAARAKVLALVDRQAERAIALAREHFAADRHVQAVHVLEEFSPWHEGVETELATLKREIEALLQRRREEEEARQRAEEEARRKAEEEARRKAEEEARRKAEEARIAREAEQAIATARAHFAADRHAEAVRVLEAFAPRERVEAELVTLKRDIAAVQQRRREEEEARRRAEEEARIAREAEQAIATAREHFAADRHADAVRVLEAFAPRERVEAELVTLKRDIAAVQKRRRDEEARIAREAERAITAAREHYAAGRDAEAVRVLEDFSPRQRVENELASLKYEIAAEQRRRAEEEARIARAAEKAIAAAREHFEADRHAEAVRVLDAFSPRERVETELATLKRDIAAVQQRRRDEEARITREAERAIAAAREHFAADRHNEAVRALETFSPRLPHVEAELATLKRDIAAVKQRRREEEEARRKAEEETRLARKVEAAIAAAREHFAADRHAEAVRVLEEFYPRQRVEAELVTLKRDIAALQQRRREEEDARKRAEEDARKKREADEAKKRAEAEARRKADEARQRAEAEARRKAEEEARLKAAEEARLAREAEDARKRAEAEEEARLKAAEDARLAREAEARRQAQEAARLAAEAEEARKLAEEEARRKSEDDARLKAEEEARLAREAAEARQRAEEEARLEAEEAARLAREAEAEAARKRAEDEAQRKREADAKRAREAEEARKAADAQAARLREEEAARQKAEEARLAREAEDARKRADERASRLKEAEETRKRAEEEARRLREAEEDRLLAEAQALKQREEEAAREREADEARRREELKAKARDDEAARLRAQEERQEAETAAREREEDTAPQRGTPASQAEAEARRAREAAEARQREEADERKSAEDTARVPGRQDTKKRAGDEWKRKPGGKAAAKAAQKAAAEKAAADKAAADKAARERDAAAAASAATAASTLKPGSIEDEDTRAVAVPESIRRAAAAGTVTAGTAASTRGARDRQAREAADRPSATPAPLPGTGAGASSNTMLYGGIGAAALLVIAVVGWFTLGGSNPAQDTQKQDTQVADATLKPAEPPVTPNSGTTPGSASPGGTDTTSNPTSPATPGAVNPPSTEAPATPSVTDPSATATPGTPPSTPPPGETNTTDPNAAANAAAAREKAIDDAVINLRRMIDRGQRQQALELLGQHLMTYQNAPKLQAQLTDMVNTAQRDADRARTEALRARAAERAVPELQRAENTLRESAQLRQRNRQTDAARSYWRAQNEFAEAGRLAATRPATLPTTPVTTQANNQPPSTQQLPPPTSQQNPPVTPRVDPPPAQVKTEPPPVRPEQQPRPELPQPPAQTADSRAAIQQALNRYAAAHASLSAAQVASVWRTMNPQQVRRLDEGFRQQNSHTVSLSSCSIKENGDRASAQCTLRREIAFKNGQSFNRSNAATFELEKRGNDWVIIGVVARD